MLMRTHHGNTHRGVTERNAPQNHDKKRMAATTFIISDESVNTYGFKILTAGIRLDKFTKNPVMLYLHDREKGVIGRWDNIRIEGNRLLADAVFDESDPLGKQVREKVEKGFLRTASIGIDSIKMSRIDGIDTVTECELVEVSIADIPANGNAVKLRRKNGEYVCRLADLAEPEKESLRDALLALLGLSGDVADTDIVAAVNALKTAQNDISGEVDIASFYGFIGADQRENYRAMAAASPAAFRSLMEQKRKEQQSEVTRLVSDAVRIGKVMHCERQVYENIGFGLGSGTLSRLLDTMTDRVKLSEWLEKGGNHTRAAWGLNEYRKYAPQELRDNPALYKSLLAKEGKAPDEDTYTLDYYRRNHPEYLRDNPELYARLLEKENR